MKAIIMAGGEGTRLRPISLNRPKPMVGLLDRPVLEHILRLLRSNGVTEACVTLRYLPDVVTDYFGNGEDFGVRLEYRVEAEALGTAGGVLNCAEFMGDEDFLVISGDCVCDFDLRELAAFHAGQGAEVTLALYSHPAPLEYGLVVTQPGGRIDRFIEKPAWDNVLTDQINTGIYMISPGVLADIPQGRPYDFGRDLFPKLLGDGRGLYGHRARGYWCDIGSAEAYHRCCMDALSGDVALELRAREARPGILCDGPLPEGARFIPPVYIGPAAAIGRGATIGPWAVIGAASVVEENARVSRCVINGGLIGARAVAEGAVVGHRAAVGRGAALREGAVIGDGCVVGDNAVIGTGVRLWPDRQIPAGSLITADVAHGLLGGGLSFVGPGRLEGIPGFTLTADRCLRLGGAAAALGPVAIGWSGGEAARVLAEAFGCGVCAAGGVLLRHDGAFAACAAYAGPLYGVELSVYIEESGGRATVGFYDRDGVPIRRAQERRLENAAMEPPEAAARQTGYAEAAAGLTRAYAAGAARDALEGLDQSGRLEVCVTGSGACNRALKSALEAVGCDVAGKGAPLRLEAQRGGFALSAVDEEGRPMSAEQMMVLSAYVELALGVKAVAAPGDAPDALDGLEGLFGGKILRVGRDGPDADGLYARSRILRDGVLAGARLCAFLKSRGEKLSELRRRIPEFSTAIREVPLDGDRGALMRRMAEDRQLAQEAAPAGGLRMDTRLGAVYIVPLRDRSALRIRAESFNEETAEELCAEFERRVRGLDGG